MEKYSGLEIAIVGMAGRFPGARNVGEFWDNLKNGVESVQHFTDEELKEAGVPDHLISDPLYVKANSYLEGKASFDAAFFNYTPDEARLMDPQMRIFHECVWEAMEDAGLNLEKQQTRIGLFAGGANNFNWEAYAELMNREGQVDNFSASQLSNVRFMPTKISYLLNLKGPSLFIDTACSTSLVAIHQACKSLLLEECHVAIAGGVAIVNRSKKGYLYKEGMINSADGHCRPFDAEANGTVGGEGAGVIVLKRLKYALADRDNILAVIKGTGVNNDGKNKVGYAAPSVDGQAEAIMTAQKWAGVSADSIGYVEAHGTATRLGDPVEVEALTRVFGNSKEKYCALGSVKSNIGHLDVAAGVAGVIKTVLALQHRQLPPSLHFSSPNPKISFEESPFYVNTQLREWHSDKYPLRAGVSSFGIGGTNAHVILEEAPAPNVSTAGSPEQLLVFSGKTAAALDRNIERFKTFLQANPGVNLADAAYTLQTCRIPFAYRKAMVAKDHAFHPTGGSTGVVTDQAKPVVVFMFSGQGAQYADMFCGLYETEATFRKAADSCLAIIQQCSRKDLKPLLFDPAYSGPKDILHETEYTQPALFVVEYALAQLLISWGIQPDMMIGHSIGEYIAACISGAMSLSDALTLVVTRGALMQKSPKGSMLGISISRGELQPYLEKTPLVSLAAVNSQEQCTVAGTDDAIAHFKTVMEAAGHTATILKTSHAFHSYMMDGILNEFEAAVKKVQFHPIRIPFISNLSGTQATDDMIADPQYWVKHLRQPVAFAEGIAGLEAGKQVVFVEVGPGKVLSSLVRTNKNVVVSLGKRARETGTDLHHLLAGLGMLWSNGVIPSWDLFYQQEQRQKISLPAYSFAEVVYPADVNAYEMITDLIAQGSSAPKQSLYVPTWKKERLTPTQHNPQPGILFTDTHAAGLDETGYIVVKSGQAFKQLSATVYELRHGNEADYGLLISALHFPEKIIYSWELPFYHLVTLVKALHKTGQLSEKEIVLLTNDLYTINGHEKPLVAQSLSTALMKVIAQEYPGVTTSHIDISLSVDFNKQTLYDTIAGAVPGKVMAVRNQQRWVQVFDAVTAISKSPFKQGGTYLITGGLGQLGHHLATYLQTRFEAKVALLGRTALAENPDNDKLSRYQALERLPGNIMYRTCDVSDLHALQAAIQQIEAQLGPVSGIIHAAGNIDLQSKQLHELTPADFERQFAPKVQGLENLDAIFGSRELDFCFLTSSLSAVLGGLGFAAYAPANAYMDHYITAQREKGLLQQWQSINFDGLNFSTPIYQIFEQAFSLMQLPQIVVSDSDLQQRLDNWISKKQLVADNSAAMEVQADESIEDRLIKLWEDFFGKTGIHPDADFFETGGDSLKALTMVARIQKHFHADITIADFFRQPNIRALSHHIQQSTVKQVAVTRAVLKDYYPLSSSQLRLYFLHELEPASLAYNLPRVMRLKGTLDIDRLNNSFKKLIHRHESLRTSMVLSIEGKPVQQIAAQVPFELQYFTAGQEHDLDAFVKRFVQPFDLSQAPLLRVGVVKIAEQEYLLMLDMHHSITDGVSQGILIRDFMRFYEGGELEVPALQYKDYAEWQQGAEQQVLLSAQKAFWKQQFEEEADALHLPADFQRPLNKSYRGGSTSFTLGRELTAQLIHISEKQGATLFMTMLSIFNVLLRKLSNQDDIVIGVPVAGRDHADLEGIVGMFVNTLAIRNVVDETQSFNGLLAQVKQKTLACLQHRAYQYEALVDELKLSRDAGRNALFDVMFSYENFASEALHIAGLELAPYEEAHPMAKWDLTLLAKEDQEGQLFLELTYACDLFEAATAARFMDYLHRIIQAVAASPAKPLSQINMLSAEEENQLLLAFNQTATVFPANDSLVDMFARQVALTPDHAALMCNGEKLSYADLDRYSDYVAQELMILQTGHPLVALYFEPGFELMISIWGVLKAGKAFLALDPAHKSERSERILADSGCDILITEKNLQNILSFTGRKLLLDASTLQQVSVEKVMVQVKKDDLAYVIYTSGSTGKPKGVKISHTNLVNYICWYQQFTHLSSADKLILTTSITFDGGFTSIFPILMTGGSLHLVPQELYHSPDELLAYFDTHGITHLKITPSLFLTLLDADSFTEKSLSSFKYIVIGGEAIKPEDVRKALAFAPHTQFINHYGPTETTIGSIAQYIDRDTFDGYAQQPTIGKPVSNTQCYILGKYNELLPLGSVGELCIGGAGVGMGYLGDEKLTADKFVVNPYRQDERLYKTGDLARWTAEGRIEFLGRRDNQVKIRGFRIELGEIESRLRSYNKVKEAIVILRENSYLVAYYTAEKEIPAADLRSFLLASLPDYMLPAHFVWLEKMPLTSSLKVDRKMLPAPEQSREAAYAAPVTKEEQLLCGIWAKVLGLDKISTTDNFFAIGGDSIKSIQIRSRLRTAGYDMSVKDTFSFQTIGLLATRLKPLKKVADQSVVSGEIPLTGVQRRFFDSKIMAKSQYNQSVMLNFPQRISAQEVLTIFTALQNHHDALRMVYAPSEYGVVQYNRGLDHSLSCVVENVTDQAGLLAICNQIQSSIDLENGPLMKLGLFDMSDGTRLLIVVHHLIIDGVSWRILFEDIETLYTQLKTGLPLQLPLKTDAFKTWSEKIIAYRDTSKHKNAISYWNAALNRKQVNIRSADPAGLNLTDTTETLKFQLDEELTARLLGEVHKPFSTQMNDILLAAFLMSVNKHYGPGALQIDQESHGREELTEGLDVGRTVGWFTSIYPVL
ncbi:non-ribosomal peptide synthetase/type I polyketide synthase, partial [Chitinophaga sp.]|uniref:non-ribosomal peptide synthetase/type I polyketide synthase n=1 Tax=Chitinophaga sp. TaxID=1869181 RepID=UPI002F948980